MQPLTLSLVQAAPHWHAPERNRAMFDEWLARVPADSQLVVLPEMFATGFTMDSAEVAEPMTGPTVAWLREAAARLGKTLCGSLAIADGGRYYNRLFWAQPDGTLRHYDKRHLFRMADEHRHYAAGGPALTVELAGWRIRPFVCYDLRFPVWLRNRFDQAARRFEYDLCLFVANWPAPRREAWRTLLRARAIENLAWCIGVNRIGTDGNGLQYAGDSAVIDPVGTVVAELAWSEQVHSVTLDPQRLHDHRERFPAWRDADAFVLQS